MPHRGFAFSQRSVDVSHFSMVPRADVPRSIFEVQSTHKTTFECGWLVPVYLEEVLPGDSFRVTMTAFCRTATPIFPIMDNMHLESFFFFVPCRLVWSNWQKFMGEQLNPGDSTDFVIPSTANLAPLVGSIYDYFGLPLAPLLTAPINPNALPFRAYNLVYNEWFRDENLAARVAVPLDDGPDPTPNYALQRRGKRHDYFTSCLPWAQKGTAVPLPLSQNSLVPVRGIGSVVGTTASSTSQSVQEYGGVSKSYPFWQTTGTSGTAGIIVQTSGPGSPVPQVWADLSATNIGTINDLRNAFQIQKLLERDARGGTRYIEMVRSHFGVVSPDSRLQRPEYLGGGHSMVNISPIAQAAPPTASASPPSSQNTPIGTLGAVGTSVAQHGFSHSFTEHGYILGIVSVRADLTYQQGLRKLWSRKTRYDFYFPVFAHLGEQAVLRKEIYCKGVADAANDNAVFGYQERWAEYRHKPSMITGMFRSGISGTLDSWHLSQYFATPPTLGQAFIEDNPPVQRVFAAGNLTAGQHILFDSVFQERRVRAMPAYSVPGFIDRF